MTAPREVDDAQRRVASAHRSLEASLDGVVRNVTRPIRLPDWTVGHVLTHLARNADSVIRRLNASMRDEVVEQYVGGVEGRARQIEEGCSRPYDEQVADILATNQLLEETGATARRRKLGSLDPVVERSP